MWGLLAALVSAQAPPAGRPGPVPSGQAASLLEQAASAETSLRIDLAKDRLYQLLTEHPGTEDAHAARVRLARLLALSGATTAALNQCQLLRDEIPRDHPLQAVAMNLSTILARRLRASQDQSAAYFSTADTVVAKGLTRLDEPRALVFEQIDRWVLLDKGDKRVYRVDGDTVTAVPTPKDPTGLAFLPGGVMAIAGATGLTTTDVAGTRPLAGSWRGRARQAKDVRSMAGLSDGNLLVLDEDYDGVLQCQPATGACAPWGPIGKFQTVRAGPSDWVYLLDEKGQSVQVYDGSKRLMAAFGPLVANVKLEKAEDMAVDSLHGVYLLDTKAKRVYVFHLSAGAEGKFSAPTAGAVLLPQAGNAALKNPSAIGVAPDGTLIVAGRSTTRIERYR